VEREALLEVEREALHLVDMEREAFSRAMSI